MTRVANFAQNERNLAYILNTQSRLYDGQVQVSSGKKSVQYSGVAQDTRRLLNIEASHTRTSQYIENNNLVEQRLQIMETNVAQIFDIASDFKTLLVNALNADNSADLAMPTQAQSMLDELTGLLNVEYDGRYLFSGTRTTTAPVLQSDLPGSYTVPTSDGDASAYYQGNATEFTLQADEDFTIQYGVTASETGFERVIRALHMIVIGAPNDRDVLNDAQTVMELAITGISDIRTGIGASRSAIDNVNTRLSEYQLFSEQTMGDLENADLTEIITRMSADEVAMEAAFSIIARLSDLTLNRFLR
jgi:flagellar hook-associated protein 3 FlgL